MKINRYAFCFVFDSSGHVLVIKRSVKSRNRPGEWDLPGGVIEAAEHQDQGVVREILEETGLDVNNLELIVRRGGIWKGVYHEFSYYRADISLEDNIVSLSSEHEHYEWHEPLVAATMISYLPHKLALSKRKW